MPLLVETRRSIHQHINELSEASCQDTLIRLLPIILTENIVACGNLTILRVFGEDTMPRDVIQAMQRNFQLLVTKCCAQFCEALPSTRALFARTVCRRRLHALAASNVADPDCLLSSLQDVLVRTHSSTALSEDVPRTSVHSVPDDALCSVFEFLGPSSIFSVVSGVCRQWFCVAMGDKHWTAIKGLRLSALPSAETQLIFEKWKSLRHLSCNIDMTDEVLECVSHACPDLVSLALCGCDAVTSRGITSLSRLTRLESVVITDSSHAVDDSLADALSHWSMLRRLVLKAAPAMVSAKSLAPLGARCPNIVTLDVSESKGFDDEAAHSLAVCSSLLHLTARDCWRLTDTGLSDICNGAPHLQCVDLARCYRLSDQGTSQLAGCTRLRCLSLESCSSVSDKTLGHLASSCRLLSELNVASTNISDSGLALLGRECRLLSYLNASSCNGVTDTGVAHVLSSCKHLASLDVSACIQVSSKSLISVAGWIAHRQQPVPATWRHAGHDVSDPCCRDEQWVRPMQRQPVGFSLSLQGCSEIDSRGVSALLCSDGWLSELNISRCRITDSALASLGVPAGAQQRDCLRSLQLSGCDALTDRGMVGISLCSGLTHLDLSGCPKLALSLSSIARGCTQLLSLNVRGCRSLTDDVFGDIERCPKLRKLVCSYCPRLTDAALVRVVKCCRMLEILDVENCSEITDVTVMSVACYSSVLQELSLARCHRITDGSVDILLRKAREPHSVLRRLDVSECRSLSDRMVEHFRSHAKFCNIVS